MSVTSPPSRSTPPGPPGAGSPGAGSPGAGSPGAGSSPAGRSGRAAKAAKPKREPGRILRAFHAVRKLTVDWLDRPMTSLHLVLALFALMLGFGLLMVLSSSSVSAFRQGGSSFSVFANQATYAALGLICFWATQFVPVRWLRSTSTAAVIISLGLLVLVVATAAPINGAKSWIRIAGFQFQPSEIAKLALLLWAAHVLAARRSTLGSPKALLIPVLPVFVLMAGLIMLQPDLGTTVALTIVFMAVLFFAGAPWWIFAGLAAAGVAGFFYLAISAEYRLARLLSFIDPEAHKDVSYQLLQSLYGMGNGGWFGVGLGQSRAKWSYLPNAESDFIFAIVGEELGLIGASIVLLLFALLAYTGLRIARRNVDPFVKIVASASTVWLVGQAAINIGYVVGLLPVTGIPLPMISAGGTSLLITMVVFGLLANFARREPQAAAALQAGGGGRIARFLGVHHGDSSHRPVTRRRRRGTTSKPVAATTGPPSAAPSSGGPRPAAGSTRWSPPAASSARPGRPPARRAAADDPRRAGSSDARRAAPSDPRRAGSNDPRRAPSGDPRRARSADPRRAASGDPRRSAPADPRRASQPRSGSTPVARGADGRRGGDPRRETDPRRDGAPRPAEPRSNGNRGADDPRRRNRRDGA